MAWVTPTNVATGDVLTASTWNQAVVENTSVVRNAQINVKSTIKTDSIAATVTTTFATVTGMTVTITPSSATSKVLLIASFTCVNNDGVSEFYYRLVRDSTAISVGDSAGSRVQTTVVGLDNNSTKFPMTAVAVLDSPATTSAVTYALQWRTALASATGYFNRSKNDTDNATFGRTASNITAIEVPV